MYWRWWIGFGGDGGARREAFPLEAFMLVLGSNESVGVYDVFALARWRPSLVGVGVDGGGRRPRSRDGVGMVSRWR